MCKWTIPLQYAYTDPNAEPGREFKRFETPIVSDAHLKAVRKSVTHTSEYLSVYGWTGWTGGKITPEISKTAIVGGLFLDFDDDDDPQKAIRDAAEVAAYVGHSTCKFSGAKGAHVLIHCNPVNLIPDLKSSVIRGFANMLADRLPELSTMDWSVIGDTSRVYRIIDSVHPKTKLHAIGLTAYELATLTIDEIHEMAQNRRGLIQVPEPSQWVSDELYRIEGDVLQNRLARLHDKKQLSHTGYHYAIRWLLTQTTLQDSGISEVPYRAGLYDEIKTLEDEWRRIRLNNAPKTDGITGRSPGETWLLKVVDIFKVVQRMNSIQPAGSKISTSPSEHGARCHITKLMRDCGWGRGRMHEVFSHADDYKHDTTERMINSLIGMG